MVHTDIIQYLSEIDTNAFLYFNGIHSPFWDYFMTSFTGKIIWVPMYASILYILLRNFHWKAVLCYVAAIALIITFADQMCSSIIRPVVARLRPSNPESPIVDMVYISSTIIVVEATVSHRAMQPIHSVLPCMWSSCSANAG